VASPLKFHGLFQGTITDKEVFLDLINSPLPSLKTYDMKNNTGMEPVSVVLFCEILMLHKLSPSLCHFKKKM
jgi:hypothetical protein